MPKVRKKSKGFSDTGSFDYDEFEKEAINRLKEGAVLVGNALSKIYKGLEELEKPEKAEKVELPVSASTKK